MSFKLLRARITTHIKDALAAETISEPIEYPNIRFNQPESGAWMRLTIVPGRTNPTAVGGASQRRRRTVAVVTVQVFIPEQEGTDRAYEICDALSRQLDYKREGTNDVPNNERLVINYRTFGITPAATNKGFSQHNLQCDILSDMLETA